MVGSLNSISNLNKLSQSKTRFASKTNIKNQIGYFLALSVTFMLQEASPTSQAFFPHLLKLFLHRLTSLSKCPYLSLSIVPLSCPPTVTTTTFETHKKSQTIKNNRHHHYHAKIRSTHNPINHKKQDR